MAQTLTGLVAMMMVGALAPREPIALAYSGRETAREGHQRKKKTAERQRKRGVRKRKKRSRK